MRIIQGKELAGLQERVKEYGEQQRAQAMTAMVEQVKAEGGTPEEQREKFIQGYLKVDSSTAPNAPRPIPPGKSK